MKKYKNKRPQSYFSKDITNDYNNNKHIPINCGRNPSANNNTNNKNSIFREKASNDNKNYKSKNPYTNRFKSQVKRYNMYSEMWNKSLSDEDYYGISESIKIQQENKNNDNSLNEDKYKVNATNTRLSSATTYCDISYKSKRLIKVINSDINNILNLNTLDKNKTNYQNNKISTNTIYDINKDKDYFTSLYTNYNTKSTLSNKNNYNNENNKYTQNSNLNNLNLIGINNSINLTTSSNNANYRSFSKDYKTKEDETIIETELKKTIDIEDKDKLKKVINDCDTSTLNLRTEYLIKLSKLLEMYKKFQQYSDYFRVEKRDIYAILTKVL